MSLKNSRLNVVVIGVGMYSIGRGTTGYGTVLPALMEWKRAGGNLGKICFVGTSQKTASLALEKANKMEEICGGVKLDITIFPENLDNNLEDYKSVISNISHPACAIIVVPDHLHYTVAKNCLSKGLPVLMVKPLTPTVKEGKKLVKLADEKNLYAVVEFHKRWDKANLMMRDEVQSGRLGNPLYCWVEYSQRKSIPSKIFEKWAEKTSILQYLGIHYIDVVRFVTNATPKRVMATGQKKWLIEKGLNTYDSIQCVIEWEMPNGHRFIETILTNWIDPESSSSMSDQKIKIVGEKGRFESDQKERGIRINTDESGIEQPNPYFCSVFGAKGKQQWRGYGIDSVKSFLTDIVEINTGVTKLEDLADTRPVFRESLISTAVVEAAHFSLENNNQWENIKL